MHMLHKRVLHRLASVFVLIASKKYWNKVVIFLRNISIVSNFFLVLHILKSLKEIDGENMAKCKSF